MKLLGIDYGHRRIGLATTDLGGTIASPLFTVENRGERKNIEALCKIITDNKIQGIMCGIPQDMGGRDTSMSVIIREFCEKLSHASGLEVVYVNERYSSLDAEEHIRKNLGIKNPIKIREMVDKMVACMLLQEYVNNKS